MNASGAIALSPDGSSPARVAKAIAGIFRGAALSHGGMLYHCSGVQAKIGTERHQIPEDLNLACDELVRVGRHPALAMARQRATPFDLLASDDLPADDPCLDRFVSIAHREGFDSIFIFPLRAASGEVYAASGLRRDRPLTPIEARLVHSYCLDALAALDAPRQLSSAGKDILTPRERQCLLAAGGGKTEKDTARELDISPSTVHAHLESCKRKLRARNKIEAIVRAIQAGAIAPEDF